MVYNKAKKRGVIMSHKDIFSTNLKNKMEDAGKTRRDICEALGFSYYTVTDWVKGKKMPRMDKVEKLANYFNCLISDLIEEKTEEQLHIESKNDILSDIILTLREDSELLDIVESLTKLDADKRTAIKSLINAFSTTDK